MESGITSPSVSFSSDGRLTALASEKGCYIYDLEQSKLIHGPLADAGGEGCGLIAIESGNFWICTGNDSSPGNSSRLVRVFDSNGNILAYRVTPTPILAIRIFQPPHTPDEEALCIILTETVIYIYDAGLEVCKAFIDTEPNPEGALAIPNQAPLRLAYPAPSLGAIRVSTINGESFLVGTGKFSAPIQLITFSPSGKCIAATDTGTDIYVFTLPSNGVPESVHSYHRGMKPCKMTSLYFCPDKENILCCSSDRTTIHIFNVVSEAAYFGILRTQWNHQIKVETGGKCWCFFSKDSTRIYRVTASNVSVYSLDFKIQNPEPKLLSSRDFIPPQ